MGTTGTIMGVSRYLKEQNSEVEIIGVQPEGESQNPGIRRWPDAYVPRIYQPGAVDQIIDVSRDEAEHYTRLLESHDNFAMQQIKEPADIYPVFREFFQKQAQ